MDAAHWAASPEPAGETGALTPDREERPRPRQWLSPGKGAACAPPRGMGPASRWSLPLSFKGERKSIGVRSRVIPFRHCLKPRTQSRPVYSGQRGGSRPVPRHGTSVTLVFASFKKKELGLSIRHREKPRTQSCSVFSGQRDGLRPAPRHKSSLLLSFKKEGQERRAKGKDRPVGRPFLSALFGFTAW